MLLVSDANIFIDFEVAGLAAELFQLRHDIVVPDALFEQELSVRHTRLIELGLRRQTLTGEQVAEAYQMQTKYRGTGVFDLLALVLAKSLNCALVTGDRKLREAATAEGLQLMGTLTLIEHLYVQGILDLRAVESAYQRMQIAGRRIPAKEVAAQLARLRRLP